MEILDIRVDTQASHRLPWKETLILPVGDLQLGAAGCDEDRFRRHIQWGIKNSAYFLGMGDYVDVASPSNRVALNGLQVYDSVKDALENNAEEYVKKFLKLVRGTEGRWLGILEGHHFYEFRNGDTSDTRIADALDAPFLGTSAFVRLHFADKANHSVNCTIWCHHGAGSGQAQAAPLNRLERIVQGFDADVYLIGHYSRKSTAPVNRLYMTPEGKLRSKKLILAATGGFVKAYEQNARVGSVHARGGYAEQAMYTPVALGGVLLTVRPARGADDVARLDLSCEV